MRFAPFALAFLCLAPPALADDAVAVEAPAVEEAIEEAPAAPEEEEEVEEEAIPDDFNEAAEDAADLAHAIESKNWPLAIGFILMLVVFGANKFGLKDKVGSKAVPWVALGLAVASTVGVALSSGVAVSTAVIQGLTAGLAAIGSWEGLFKHILGTKAES
tara:strand:- start:995 stop:1474 length:480 start_codon:yes stop_codon:yes gene_type:complete